MFSVQSREKKKKRLFHSHPECVLICIILLIRTEKGIVESPPCPPKKPTLDKVKTQSESLLHLVYEYLSVR